MILRLQIEQLCGIRCTPGTVRPGYSECVYKVTDNNFGEPELSFKTKLHAWVVPFGPRRCTKCKLA